MTERRIASRDHNHYVEAGVEKHRPTKAVPDRLLRPWPVELVQTIQSRQAALEASLRRAFKEPCFTAPGFILFDGDCLDLLDALKHERIAIDLCLTSPPYNIGKAYERPLPIPKYVDWCVTWMNRIYDITSDRGAFWLNLGYLEVPDQGLCVPIPYLLWNQSPFYLLQEVVWHYGAGVSSTRRLSPRNEKWLFYVKNADEYAFNLDDIRDPNVKYPHQKKKGKFRCNPLGKNPSDVWAFPKVTTGEDRSSQERTAHPAQFPLQVVERIVLASSNAGQFVLDPFAGSCSAGIAACGLGRIFIGIEIDRRYCQMAVERFEAFSSRREAFAAQPPLF